jgi:hypothetical protein
MLNDHRFVAIGCLKDPPRTLVEPQPRRGGCCGGHQAPAPPVALLDYNGLKQRIADASVEDKAKIRALLDGECVVLQYKTPNGGLLKAQF